jgi:mannose-1-phosphate guanylyltransferase / phosphomannomutase
LKVVILAGGKGTRMGDATKNVPKPMIRLAGKPILEYQISLAKRYGIVDIIILTGYKHEIIENYFEDGTDWGVNIQYRKEDFPLGTSGALKEIELTLTNEFLVFYGDIMMDVDLESIISLHLNKKPTATIAVHPNDHPYDSDLVEVDDDNKVVAFHSKPHDGEKVYRNLVNAALYVLSPSVLKHIKKGVFSDFGKDIFPKLLSMGGSINAYNTTDYIKDIGTRERLKEAEKDVVSGRITMSNRTNMQKAIFLDRDGVLNREVDNLHKVEEFQLLPGVSGALKKINKSNYLSVVITNQPVVAKGFLTERELDEIHCFMEFLLGKQRAYVDRIYYCPHHPDRGFMGERIDYKIECNCRKPKTGMIDRAVKELNINKENSFFIGDSTADIMAGINAGLKTILVRTGHMGEDGKYKCKADFVFENLKEAIDFIVG